MRFKGEDRNALDKWLLLEVGPGAASAASAEGPESADLKLRSGLSPMSTRTWCWPEKYENRALGGSLEPGYLLQCSHVTTLVLW